MQEILYLIIPCYNEEEVLPETAKRVGEKLKQLIGNGVISEKSRAVFVSDGSKDKTWELITELHLGNKLFSGVNLAKNSGHQNAVLAGLMFSKEYADIMISMDADLQDDINAIDEMVAKYYAGNDIVYGVRNSRKRDSFFKKNTARAFYKFMQFMGTEVVYNHADYRLMSKRTVEKLSEFSETNLFLRGIIPLIGFNSEKVYYERDKRFAGKTKYPLKKMVSFAVDAITSFSVKPLRIISILGFLIFGISIIAMIYALYAKFAQRVEIGWTSMICSIWMIGGIQLLCLGVVGEYIGRIYSEVKHRPRYVIEKYLNQ